LIFEKEAVSDQQSVFSQNKTKKRSKKGFDSLMTALSN